MTRREDARQRLEKVSAEMSEIGDALVELNLAGKIERRTIARLVVVHQHLDLVIEELSR